jgi:hypothetical protein
MESNSLSPSLSYKIIYLIPVPFLFISLCIFACCARKETISYYTQNGDKNESIGLMKRVVPGKDIEYYERKYKEVRDNGMFWSYDDGNQKPEEDK